MALKFLSYDTLSELIVLIKTALNGKVDKIDGRQLSQENFTTVLKNKLNDIQTGAKDNTIETIKIDSQTLTPQQKIVTIPLASSSQNGIMTKAHYNKIENIDTTISSMIRASIGEITGISYVLADNLSNDGEAGVIYLVRDSGGKGDNIYKEYIWFNGKYEQIGTTEIDISGKLDKADLVEITSGEIAAMWK